ncbi:MAG TPA: DUF177 domain-containing protein [Bryobacteraceae bacterium]|nr:DUF177 domain-containing protein [Bryobacteraceae bacterium]
MFFHIRDLELKARPFEVTLEPGVIEFFDPKLRQKGTLKASGVAELVSDVLSEVRVKGHVSVLMDADCDRCLEPAEFPIDADFQLYYRPVTDGYGEEREIDEGEAEMGFFEGDGLKLNDVLREFVLLTLPMQRVCSEDCKGICPECGQNRNKNKCACQTASVDDRWAALKKLN